MIDPLARVGDLDIDSVRLVRMRDELNLMVDGVSGDGSFTAGKCCSNREDESDDDDR